MNPAASQSLRLLSHVVKHVPASPALSLDSGATLRALEQQALARGGQIADSIVLEGQPRGSIKQREEGHFELSRIESGKTWLKSHLEEDEIGPIRVPPEICAHCRVGWDIGGEIGRSGTGWCLVDVWNVSPKPCNGRRTGRDVSFVQVARQTFQEFEKNC